MFTYSHANTTLGPSERVYCLGYSHWWGSTCGLTLEMWLMKKKVLSSFLKRWKLPNARRQAQSLTAEKYLCHDCKIRMHSPSSNVIYWNHNHPPHYLHSELLSVTSLSTSCWTSIKWPDPHDSDKWPLHRWFNCIRNGPVNSCFFAVFELITEVIYFIFSVFPWWPGHCLSSGKWVWKLWCRWNWCWIHDTS